MIDEGAIRLRWDTVGSGTLRAILRGQVPLASKAAVGNLNITPTHGSIVATSLTKFAMGSRSAPVWSKPEARSGARSYGIESDAIICSLPRWVAPIARFVLYSTASTGVPGSLRGGTR